MAKGKRRATSGGWRQVAPLVPLALFASAFTVSATDDPAVATAALDKGLAGGNPIVVPKDPIADPASIPVPGTVGPGIDRGEQPTQVVSGLSRNGIPTAALKAYSRAQQVMAQVDPSCQLPWTLVAAIGRVESNHGRFGGNSLNSNGVAVPGIYGPRLDGSNTARISDTDAGKLDGDGAFDRAVGPMQFIPGTWRSMGVDGDGDGVKNPQDIDDAAMSTAVYLCSGNTNLSKAGDLNQAVLRYNHSQAYVDLVISIAKAYAGGSWIAVGNGTSDDPGYDRAGGRIDDPNINAPADNNLPQAVGMPVYPAGSKPTQSTAQGGSGNGRPGSEPTKKPGSQTNQPGQPGSSKPPTSQPSTPPTIKPPTTKPAPGLATLQTAAGLIVGTVGSTVSELTKATQYCQSEMSKVTITHPTQDQLQKCVTAYQTGGTAAVDKVIRNLLSVLGLLGVLGGGILGN
jgi:hypothetical protein